jgi:hypothetical protein
MCVNQKCMAVGSLRQQAGSGVCPQNCNGNGVCNSRGHCHCAIGYAPPLCDYPGIGGSEDSGPASDPSGEYLVYRAEILYKMECCLEYRFKLGHEFGCDCYYYLFSRIKMSHS